MFNTGRCNMVKSDIILSSGMAAQTLLLKMTMSHIWDSQWQKKACSAALVTNRCWVILKWQAWISIASFISEALNGIIFSWMVCFFTCVIEWEWVLDLGDLIHGWSCSSSREGRKVGTKVKQFSKNSWKCENERVRWDEMRKGLTVILHNVS